jgi:hypothetical protein
MEKKSSFYHDFNIRYKLDILISYALILYPIFFLLTKVNLGSIIIGTCFIYVLYNYKFLDSGFDNKLIISLLFLTFGQSVLIGFINGFEVTQILSELYFYSKSVLFYFFGIICIYPHKNAKFYQNLTEIVFTGTIVFFIFPEEFVEAAHLKSGIGSGWGHFTSFNFLLRSGSIFLSPLETAFVSSFLGIYFFYFEDKLKNGRLYFIVSTLCLLLSVTRSVTIIYATCIVFIYLDKKINVFFKWTIWAIPLLFILVISMFGWIFKDEILSYDGSIMLHFQNLNATVANILNKPFGYGMSSSGYASVLAGRDKLYSEGSFFTYIIECGVQSIFLFVILGYYTIKQNALVQALFIFYLLVSFVLPIGFSTPFCFLYFGYLGSLRVRNESSYLNN